MIEFKNVSKTYEDGVRAVQDISFKVNKGELLTLIGPSGCGKTTTMKMINRLIEPTHGDIYIDNKKVKTFNVHELRWNIGYVLQEIALFPHLTVAENIAVVPEMKKWKTAAINKRSKELLNMVGLDADVYAKKMPDELSGGEQQRVGVIRALAADPDIILMDEPFSALDPISRELLQQDILSLQAQIKKTIVFVTHDINEALALGDRVCLMRDGKVVQMDKPQRLVNYPVNDFVNRFIGSHRSPWQSAIDIIGDLTMNNVVQSRDIENNEKYRCGIWVVIDGSGRFQYMLLDGKTVETEVLANDTSLDKASDILAASPLDIIPIRKNKQIIGTLSNRNIVNFLHKHAADGGGRREAE